VDQGSRDTGRLGDLFEGDEQGIVLREETLGSVDDEAPASVRVQAWRAAPRGAGGLCQAIAFASAPARLTVSDSPGSSGWWHATK
jgi:hypothetical protein